MAAIPAPGPATRDTTAEMGYIHANPPPDATGLMFGPKVTSAMYKKARHEVIDVKLIPFIDARSVEGGLASWSLDTHGFQVFDAPPPMDFTEGRSVKEEYYPKLCEAAKKMTGASYAYCFAHGVRDENPQNVGIAYSRFAHTDASPGSVPGWRKLLKKKREKIGISEEEASDCEIMMVNIWHPRERPAWRDPLCLLDVSTVDLSQDVSKIKYRDFDSPLVGPIYSPHHRWIYIPDQRPDEAWIFKDWDTREGGAQCSFHNSFHDPFYDNHPNVRNMGRRSIEFRMLLTFSKGARAPPSKARPYGGAFFLRNENINAGKARM